MNGERRVDGTGGWDVTEHAAHVNDTPPSSVARWDTTGRDTTQVTEAPTLPVLASVAPHNPSGIQGAPRHRGRHLFALGQVRLSRRSVAALIGALLCLLVVATVLGLVGSRSFGGAFLPALSGGTPQARPRPTPVQSASIVQENALPGTSAWMTPPGKRSTTQIQAYLSATSLQPGRILSFYVSTQTAGTPYSINIFRLGWYGGAGARLLLSTNQVGEAQGYYDALHGKLVGCATCRVDGRLGLIEADWHTSYRLTIPSDWITGVYLAQLTDAQDFQTSVTFDVLGSEHSTYVIVTTDTTVAAYNEWGGASLYIWRLQGGLGGHARKVSLDRPVAGQGEEQGLFYEIDGIRWVERMGYDVSYISSLDLHENPDQLRNHRAYLVFGHDEYWSAEMRTGIERARDAGIGLGFFGANIGYWQIRFEPDSRGVSDRTIVNYKEAPLDPLVKTDKAHVTTKWRDPLVGQPENALIGIMYAGFATQPQGFPWHMGTDASSPLVAGTGLKAGQQYGCDLVGYEWDTVFPNGRTPAGLRVLSSSLAVQKTGVRNLSNTAYYVAPSGALVFAAGTIDWSFALDDVRLFDNPQCRGRTQPVPELQALTTNVMAALVANGTSGTNGQTT
jgi:hypothetical protein